MKKLLLSLIAIAAFMGIVPQAEARDRHHYRHHDRHYYDRHHHRSHSYSHYGHYPRYRSNYYAPRVRYYQSDYCAPRYYRSRPRFSFNIGF